mmetsp:Transcript_23748/g.66040  ORF Transcript_23748/g.66040 Transcript_23748/m.66040 type:complete len:331 (-) Transcript_23748:1168-2160(-)
MRGGRGDLELLAVAETLHQLRNGELVGDDHPSQPLSTAVQRIVLRHPVLLLREDRRKLLEQLRSLSKRGLCCFKHEAAIRRRLCRGGRLLEVAERRQVGKPKVLQRSEPKHEALRQALDNGWRRGNVPPAEAIGEEPEKSTDDVLRALEQEHRRRGIPRSLAWLLGLRLGPSLSASTNGLLFRVVEVVEVVDAQAKKVVSVPIYHVKLGLVIQVKLETQEELGEHGLQAMLHNPNPARSRVPQIRTEGVLQVLVQAPSLVLQCVEVTKDVGETPESASTVHVRQPQQVREERFAVFQKIVARLLAVLQGLPRKQEELQGIKHQPPEEAIL